MKLIVQADDFAMTDGVAEGILKCAREGILTQTGLMTNGPHAEYYAKLLDQLYPHISIGQDINLVSGKPLSRPEDIPSLVDEQGNFHRSGYHMAKDRAGEINHIPYEEAYLETEAQVKEFIRILGYKPHYIGGHAYDCENTRKAREDVVKKYDLMTFDQQKAYFEPLKFVMGPWYPKNTHDQTISQLDSQMNGPSPLEMFKKGELHYFQDYVDDDDAVCFLHTHAGFIDEELLEMSTLTITRVKEAFMLCDDAVKSWCKEHRVELIGARELNRWIENMKKK